MRWCTLTSGGSVVGRSAANDIDVELFDMTTDVLATPTKQIQGFRPGVPVHLYGLGWNDYLALSELVGACWVRTFCCDNEVV